MQLACAKMIRLTRSVELQVRVLFIFSYWSGFFSFFLLVRVLFIQLEFILLVRVLFIIIRL